MLNKYLAFLIISLSFCLAEFNELQYIPGFLATTSKDINTVSENCKKLNLGPVSYEEYISGIINVPKNYIPILIITADKNIGYTLVSSCNNVNLPMYHMNYDPLEKVKVTALKNIDLTQWFNTCKKNLFISDGEPLTISIPQSVLNQLFNYAPTEGMTIQLPTSIPFISHKEHYPSKAERQKLKKPTLKGLHVTYDAINNLDKTKALIRNLKKNNLDTVVLDFKSFFYGVLHKYPSYKAFMESAVTQNVQYSKDLSEKIKMFKDENINVSFRIVVALDYYIEQKNPSMLLWNKQTNMPWRDNNKQPWLDMFCPETVQYFKKLASIACALNADEIQLDYVRFPAEGNTDIVYSRYSSAPHYKAIDNLLKQIMSVTDPALVSFSADIFGIVLWENKKTNIQLGQNILTFMRYTDEICPMIYPSHFYNGFEGIAKPGSEPYLFNKKGSDRFKNLVNRYPQYKVLTIPWIQAFPYKAPNYSPFYIQEEIRAVYDAKMDGFLAWNAANSYDILFKALEKKPAENNNSEKITSVSSSINH
ncbi:MAG: putative glycoside hydrolase [Candidatus Margulisbacteria bacterium]|nr:putative glycoside hydrolase [Candidatus Margulisiibacteriota bacterium]